MSFPTALFTTSLTCRAKFHETAAHQIRKQLQLLAAELPLPRESDAALASMAAAGFGSHVLEDDQCEDNEDPSSKFAFPHAQPCAETTIQAALTMAVGSQLAFKLCT